MNDSNRTSEGASWTVLDIDPAHTEASWNQVFIELKLDKASKSDDWDRETLKQGLLGHVGTVVIEDSYICKDYRSIYHSFYSKRFNAPSPFCKRVHFFKNRLDPDEKETAVLLNALSDESFTNEYIGYSIIRPDGFRMIGRTVLDPNKIGRGINEGYYCLSAEFKVHLAGINLIVRGYPYISQDAESMVCAHSALWGACRFMSEKYHMYKELYPFDIISLANIESGRAIPYRGLTYFDYSAVFTTFGCHPVLHANCFLNSSRESLDSIYSYIESGFPVLASTGNHVLTLIGHTMDSNLAVAKDDNGLISSSQFANTFVSVDDNRFPYHKVEWKPKECAKEKPSRRHIVIDELRNFVIPLPEKVYLPSKKARMVLKKILLDVKVSDKISDLVQLARNGEGLVTRQFVTTSNAFKREALRRFKEDKSVLFSRVLEQPMPHFIWVLELASLPDYRNSTCMGEIVIDATAAFSSTESLLFMRAGNHVRYSSNTKIISFPNEIGKYHQFSHNLGSSNGLRKNGQ